LNFGALSSLSIIAIVPDVERQPEARMPQIFWLIHHSSSGRVASNSSVDLTCPKREVLPSVFAMFAEFLCLMPPVAGKQ
jgi:hypothetical protein